VSGAVVCGRPSGWYWVRKKGIDNRFGPWVPAEWREEVKSWYSTAFSGVPDSEVRVGALLQAAEEKVLTDSYEIRQQVGTVNKKWLEVVDRPRSDRLARLDYERMVAANPQDYFELVKVTHTEQCLAFTPIKD